jgi:peroxiredoxin
MKLPFALALSMLSCYADDKVDYNKFLNFDEVLEVVSLNEIDWSKLPRPEDDAAAAHLVGRTLDHASLPATSGSQVDFASLPGQVVLYIYPMTGRPDKPLPNGWDGIPGARGCTPQSCAFRDHYTELKSLGVDHHFGLSTQTTEYQAEAVARMHLPFPLLSDAELAFANALRLPRFEVDGMTLLKRMTLIIQNSEIVQVFYPVFPPDRNAGDVIDWLKADGGH